MSEIEKSNFRVAFEYTERVTYDVEAENMDQAIKLATKDVNLDYDDAEFYDVWEI